MDKEKFNEIIERLKNNVHRDFLKLFTDRHMRKIMCFRNKSMLFSVAKKIGCGG